MIEPNWNGVPQELQNIRQWVLWKNVVRSGKETKIPWSVWDQPASSTDPKTWSDWENVVVQFDERRHAGVGYVFSKTDGFVGIDLDSCRCKSTGVIAPWAQKWIDKYQTYTEISPSETGVKLWLKSDRLFAKGTNIKIPERGMNPDKDPGVEMYSDGRYFAVTGHVLRGF